MTICTSLGETARSAVFHAHPHTAENPRAVKLNYTQTHTHCKDHLTSKTQLNACPVTIDLHSIQINDVLGPVVQFNVDQNDLDIEIQYFAI